MDLDNIECVPSSDGLEAEDTEIQSQITQKFAPKPRPATSVHELLECPVCTNSMYPPIHQCHNGHAQLAKHECRTDLQTRAGRHQMFSIGEGSRVPPCRYFSLGCPEIFPYYSKLKHETLCNFRPYNCPDPNPETYLFSSHI